MVTHPSVFSPGDIVFHVPCAWFCKANDIPGLNQDNPRVPVMFGIVLDVIPSPVDAAAWFRVQGLFGRSDRQSYWEGQLVRRFAPAGTQGAAGEQEADWRRRAAEMLAR